MTDTKIPAELVYTFPPEWHKHRATWLSWPHNQDTWPGGIETIFDSYLTLIAELTKSEEVHINVNDQDMQLEVLDMFKGRPINPNKVKFYHHPTNDAWCRDHGPCFVLKPDGSKVVLDWDYNAWGAKYPPYGLDNDIPSKVASSLGLELVKPGVVLEGGAVDFNGHGSVITTTSCLLNQNRNPDMTREKMESILHNYFGTHQVLWLPQGIAGDDTDGHIDTTTRFVNSHTVVTVIEEDPINVNYSPLKENLAALKKMKLASGRPIEVLTLPMPKTRFNEGHQLPCTYANFYISNGAVLVPTYSDRNDRVALEVLSLAFPTREIVGIDSSEIIRGLGSFHCLCMQEPL